MHIKSTVLSSIALLALLSLTTGCKDEPPTASESSVIDRSKLCKDGGAELNSETNECVCPYAAHWSGMRCEGASDAPPAPAPAVAGAALEATQPVVPPVEPKVEAPPSPPPPEVVAGPDQALKRACRQAKAHWIETDNYCHCPKAQVLVGQKCRKLSGNVTDDTCRRERIHVKNKSPKAISSVKLAR